MKNKFLKCLNFGRDFSKKKFFVVFLVIMFGMMSIFAETEYNSSDEINKNFKLSGKAVDYVGIGLDMGYPSQGIAIRWRRFTNTKAKPSAFGLTTKIGYNPMYIFSDMLSIEVMADFAFRGWSFKKNEIDQGYLELQGIIGIGMFFIGAYVLTPKVGLGLNYILPHRFNDGAWSVYWRFMYGIGVCFETDSGIILNDIDFYSFSSVLGFSYSFDVNHNKSDWYRAIGRLEK